MKKGILYILLIVSVITFALVKDESTALTNGEVEDKTEKLNQLENIVLVGDSIFNWFPTDEIFGDLPIINSGEAGDKTTDILNDIEERIYQYNPTKVFINIGTNDIEFEDSEEINQEVYQNIIKIVKGIKANRSNSEIYVISIYPVNNHLPGAHERHTSEIKEINQKLKTYCSTTDGVIYIDAFKELIDEEEMLKKEFTEDGLHPNTLGYAKLTEILMKYIYQ